jgi:hypothetical protein
MNRDREGKEKGGAAGMSEEGGEKLGTNNLFCLALDQSPCSSQISCFVFYVPLTSSQV